MSSSDGTLSGWPFRDHRSYGHSEFLTLRQHAGPTQDEWYSNSAFLQDLLAAAEWQIPRCALRAAVVAGHNDDSILCELLIVECLEDAPDFQVETLDYLDQRLAFLFAGRVKRNVWILIRTVRCLEWKLSTKPALHFRCEFTLPLETSAFGWAVFAFGQGNWWRFRNCIRAICICCFGASDIIRMSLSPSLSNVTTPIETSLSPPLPGSTVPILFLI